MIDKLRISVSGIRGVVPDALNVESASKFASAFSSYIEEGTIAICRDFRFSSQMLQMAAVSSIIASGLDCADFGRIPVSFLQFYMQKKSFSGGIAVSAGHNPLPWNAVILLNENGCYLEASEGAEVFNINEAESFQKADWKNLGQVKKHKFPLELYLEKLSSLIDLKQIRKSKFKVVADPCHGVVSPFLEAYADNFNLTMIPINNIPKKPFPHPPEPNRENASQVEAVVKATGADFGFLLNSDGSRISLVNEKGIGLSEEFTVPLCLLSLQGKIKKAVTTSVTSTWIDWAAETSGIRLLRTKVGQSAVSHLMEVEEAEAGGEGSGSFAFLPFSPGYDALLSLTLILDLMAKKENSLSEIISLFPKLFHKKLKIPVPPEKTYRMMDRLEAIFSSEKPDFSDGIKVKRPGVWFSIRPSSTEFILRIMIEGISREIIESVEDEVLERIET